MMKIDKKMQKNINNRLILIDKILSELHGTPNLGNIQDPLEELIYLMIAQRTRIETAIRVYNVMREKYPRLEDILNAPMNELIITLSIGGRGKQRAKAIRKTLLFIKSKRGRCSLDFLNKYDEKKAYDFLRQLPGVGEKISRCVMLYSLGVSTFPADSNIIRIFTRTGILDPLIGALEGVEHRKAQELIAESIPSEIAKTLHINMVVHGQNVCKPGKPLCNSCEINKWCKSFRNDIQKKRKDKYTLVDLFSGTGGISHGFVREGFRVLLAVDNSHNAQETLLINNPEIEETRILNADITDLKDDDIRALVKGNKIDVLTAGIPCQGFSMVGYRTKPGLVKKNGYLPEKDSRNKLYRHVLRFVDIMKPEFVIIENVPGINSLRIKHRNGHSAIISLVERQLVKRGYNYQTLAIDAQKFGIPQKRRRIFCVARKKRILSVNLLEEMVKEASSMGHDGNVINLLEAIGDLPPLKANSGREVLKIEHIEKKEKNIFNRYIERRKAILYNHVSRYHNIDDMKIIRELKQGEKYKQLLLRAPEVVHGRKRKTYSAKNFPDKYYRLKWDIPSRTIVSHLSKDGNSFIHPDQNRSLTVREAARIQTFPDDYLFTGSRFSQFVQIGNAVPPLLASILGRVIIRMYKRGGERSG